MSISDRLNEIQERAKYARQVLASGTTGVPPNVAGVDVYETVDILAESATDVPALLSALRAVLNRHRRREAYDGNLDYCEVCVHTHGADWPCPTVRAVKAALGEEM